jgi:ribosomal protein S27AE
MEQHMIICPECGEGHWLSPMTLKIKCHRCGSLVFHRGLAGFIDWQAMIQQHPNNPPSGIDESIGKSLKMI